MNICIHTRDGESPKVFTGVDYYIIRGTLAVFDETIIEKMAISEENFTEYAKAVFNSQNWTKVEKSLPKVEEEFKDADPENPYAVLYRRV